MTNQLFYYALAIQRSGKTGPAIRMKLSRELKAVLPKQYLHKSLGRCSSTGLSERFGSIFLGNSVDQGKLSLSARRSGALINASCRTLKIKRHSGQDVLVILVFFRRIEDAAGRIFVTTGSENVCFQDPVWIFPPFVSVLRCDEIWRSGIVDPGRKLAARIGRVGCSEYRQQPVATKPVPDRRHLHRL